MQGKTSEKGLVRLSGIADEINEAYRSANSLAGEAIRGAKQAIKLAHRAGQLLQKVNNTVGHGNWLKWLSDNCPDISERTAYNWMRLANLQSVASLDDAKSLTDAYRIAGIIKDRPEPKLKPMGTANVDHVAEFLRKFDKTIKPMAKVVDGLSPDDLPADKVEDIKLALQPLVNYGARLGVVPVLEEAELQRRAA